MHCSEHWPQMSALIGHITAGGFSGNPQPARWPGAVLWLLQNTARAGTHKPEPPVFPSSWRNSVPVGPDQWRGYFSSSERIVSVV